MKISVDYGRCEGHGLCAEQAPAVFSLDDDVELTYRFEDPRCPTGMSPPPVRQSTHVRLRPCDFRHGDAALGPHRRRVARRTTARELRIIGHCGKVTVIGAEENGAYSRPPLSKAVLRDPVADDTLSHHLDGLDVDIVRSAAVGVDTDRCVVTTADGRQFDYGALVAAPGADARRLAAPGQRGELVLRTLDDARLLRARLETSASAIVLGAGFLGMEVAGACAARGIPVTVVDVARSLERILGGYLSTAITARAEAYGIRFVQATGYATLAGDP
ncbi:FAD-dependent oxidoreductase [Streptomyces sp. FXJ1.4098]|nr:FAD-dependent oxidoreductase [Streptomyces sp. FXJ1.4098]